MGLFDKLKGPVLYKDSNGMKRQIEILSELKDRTSGETEKLILKDRKLLEYGLQGEESLLFELMNSFTPMIILRDLHLESGDLSAQIDFVVIMRKVIFVIECKNLFGDIEVNEAGDFVRTLSYGGRKYREGIYSPITQNRRHLDLLKAIRKDEMSNLLMRSMFEKYFDENYKSVVVLANSKTVLSTRKADKGIRNLILRNDQLISHLKTVNDASKMEIKSDKTMYEIADRFLRMHRPNRKDYTAKYGVLQGENLVDAAEEESDKEKAAQSSSPSDREPKNPDVLYQMLKEYRLNRSREEEVKAYYIFTNAQLEELVHVRPLSLESLRQITGFGEVKVSKYGQDILNILHQ